MATFRLFIRLFLACLRHVYGAITGLLLIIVCCAVLFSWVEGVPLADALYFALVTALTIGYGDITPHTWAGRLLSLTAGILGLILFGIIVGISTRAVMLIMHPEEFSRKNEP